MLLVSWPNALQFITSYFSFELRGELIQNLTYLISETDKLTEKKQQQKQTNDLNLILRYMLTFLRNF